MAARGTGQRGENERGHVPIRTCVGCRGRFPAARLVRFIAGADGVVRPDIRRKEPGRGAWVCPRRECLRHAVERKAFGRAFGREVVVPDWSSLWDLLKEATIGASSRS